MASVPFFANIAQSACGTRSTSRSASSTIRGDGPFWQSASGPLALDRGLHPRVRVAEDDRAEAADEVHVLAPVDVPDAAPTPALEELRERRGPGRRVLVPVHPAGDHPARPVAERRVPARDPLGLGARRRCPARGHHRRLPRVSCHRTTCPSLPERRAQPDEACLQIGNQVLHGLETHVEAQQEAGLPPGPRGPLGAHRNDQALEAPEARADLEEPEPVDHRRHGRLRARAEQHPEEARRAEEVALPDRVPRDPPAAPDGGRARPPGGASSHSATRRAEASW